ncbi:MAG TPA: hypothetical protein VEL76_23635, partial [Gemmataceae bacterium]|nr:hypothetical protein [Gemmataceae bacterium]
MRRFCHALPTTALVVLLVGAALHANAQITPQPTPDAKLPDDQPAEDEKLLKGAGIGMDGPALVGFLRKLIPTPEDTKRVAALLEQLGDKTFRIREKAVVELKAVGPPALPGLHKVAKGGDLEISRRAERCIQAIEEQMSPAVVLAATRLLKVREAKGAVAVLLDYLPLATEPVSEEVLETLFALGGREGKVDPAIIAALKDATPARCAAAALVVGRYGTPKQRRVVEKLLDDDNLTIRLRAAQGLVCGRDKSA